MPGPEEQVILNFVEILVDGLDLNEQQRSMLLQPDRSLSIWSQTVGYTGTRQRLIKLEETGEQDIVLMGKDSDGNIDPFLTGPDNKLQVEVSSAVGELIGQILLELKLMNLHLSQVSDVDFKLEDVEGPL